MKKVLFLSFLITSMFYTLTAVADKFFNISQEKIDAVEKKYGKKAKRRFAIWDSVMESAKNKDILHQLKDVNDFWNKVAYRTDPIHWRKKDYWASPFEFLGTGAGDCEDYAIAKYFSLRQLGVPDEKLRITYVKLQRRNSKFDQAHMVLTYYHNPDSTPIVLDNIDKRLQLATKRTDLLPVYSFNASGLWQAKNKGQTSVKVGANNLSNWKSLMTRI